MEGGGKSYKDKGEPNYYELKRIGNNQPNYGNPDHGGNDQYYLQQNVAGRPVYVQVRSFLIKSRCKAVHFL